MTHSLFDRRRLRFKSLSERPNRVVIARDRVDPVETVAKLSTTAQEVVEESALAIRRARSVGRPVIFAFGAHTVKNGLGPLLIRLIEDGWVTHLATNGAGIIHDWEFAFQGASSEDVRVNVDRGEFGMWQETGLYVNLAINVGAYEGLGYGEAVGAFVEREGLRIPGREELAGALRAGAAVRTAEGIERAAAAADLLGALERVPQPEGFLSVPHPSKKYGVQAAAYRLGVPFTGHPMFGHDIIYTHPMSSGGAIGRTAERDFLSFASSISRIEGGVYLSIGSAVMSPMIFEKSFSMAQNVALGEGRHIERHTIIVVDLAKNDWDWVTMGEPPADNPAYYLRFCKTFARMGGTMRYASADNRSFLVALYRALGG